MDFDIVKYYKIFMKEIADAVIKDLSAHINYIKNSEGPQLIGFLTEWKESEPFLVLETQDSKRRWMDIEFHKKLFYAILTREGPFPRGNELVLNLSLLAQ